MQLAQGCERGGVLQFPERSSRRPHLGQEISGSVAVEQGVEGGLHIRGASSRHDVDADIQALRSDHSGGAEVRLQVVPPVSQGVAPEMSVGGEA